MSADTKTPIDIANACIEALTTGDDAPSPDHLTALIEAATAVAAEDACLLGIKVSDAQDLIVVGDIHGNLVDFQRTLARFGLPSEARPYLFLGDYVDRGACSVQCLALVCALKVAFPGHVHLLRGNHECHQIVSVYGYAEELTTRYGSADHPEDGSCDCQAQKETYPTAETHCLASISGRLLQRSAAFFNVLPLAAVVNNDVFCCHAMIPAEDGLAVAQDVAVDDVLPMMLKLDAIGALPHHASVPSSGPITDLLWGDPNDEPGVSESPRGVSWLIPMRVWSAWLAREGLSACIRSHQLVMDGVAIQTSDDNKAMVTIFTSSNYCGSCGNQGGVARIHLGNDLDVDEASDLRVHSSHTTPQGVTMDLIVLPSSA